MKFIKQLSQQQTAKRAKHLFVLLCVLFASALARFVYLTLDQGDFLKQQADNRTFRVKQLNPERGLILDSQGETLAISQLADDIWADPKTFVERNGNQYNQEISVLAELLKVDEASMRDKLEQDGRRFVYLKRQVSPVTSANIRLLDIPGIYFRKAYVRQYPYGPSTAHVVGRVNIDGVGIEGIELAFEEQLRGKEGRLQYLRDMRGNIVEILEHEKAVESQDIQLSLHAKLNYLAYQDLTGLLKQYGLTSASVVLQEVKTGRVVSLVNIPSYSEKTKNLLPHRMRNRAVTDTFEPGWLAAPFALISGLESGRINNSSKILNPFAKNDVPDELNNYGESRIEKNVADILANRSEQGVLGVTSTLQNSTYFDMLTKFGFGIAPGTGMIGEASGVLNSFNSRSRPAEASAMGLGFGFSASLIQLTAAYASLVNDGIVVQASILQSSPNTPHSLVSSANANIIRKWMTIPPDSLFHRAVPPGYFAGGIYSVTPKAVSEGYGDRLTVSSIVFLPFDEPQYVLGVLVNEPNKDIPHPERIAAEFTSTFLAKALPYLGVMPSQKEAK